MSKLLYAEFSRLFNSIIFKIGILAMVGTSLFFLIMQYDDVKRNAEYYSQFDSSYVTVDNIIFIGAFFMLITAAVLIGIFVGTEYSDGTIRNKFIAGHSRIMIYLSKVIVCAVGNAIINLTYICMTLLVGNIILPRTQMPIKHIIIFTLCSTLFLTALTTFYLIFSMMLQNKAAGAVTVLLFSIGLIITAMTIENLLSAPEYYPEYSYTDDEAEKTITVPAERNPKYLTGTKRKIYETLNEIIPSCQLYRLVQHDIDAMGKMSAYSFLEMILFTAVGICLFKRKDIR